MTPSPVVVSPNDSISSAIRKMQEGGYRHLPVLDNQNKPMGILSVKRIVHYLAGHFPTAVFNLPPTRLSTHPVRKGLDSQIIEL